MKRFSTNQLRLTPLFLFSAMAIVASCNKADMSESMTTESNAIRFKYEMTRVAGGAFEQNDAISVAAYDNGDLIDETTYSYGNSYFSSENPITYEADAPKELSYLATYPTTAQLSSSFEFDIKTNQSSADNYELSDLLAAYTDPTDSAIPTLAFRHVMSSIVVTIEVLDSSTDVTSEVSITDFNILAKASANCDVTNNSYGATTDDAVSITPVASGATYSAIIAPQTIDESSEFISVSIDGTNYIMPMDDITLQMLSGKQYSYKWSIDTTAETQSVEQLDGTINPWEDGLEDNEDNGDNPDDSQTTTENVVTISGSKFTMDSYSDDDISVSLSSGCIIISSIISFPSQSTITFTAKTGKIQKIVFEVSGTTDFQIMSSIGTSIISMSNNSWSGDTDSVTFTVYSSDCQLKSFTVTLSAE